MKELIILRAPGEILRSLVTASGYRPFFVDKGLIQDLEDQALEKRGASNFELLQDCQIKWLQAIREDCGANWHDLVDSAWQRHSDFLRSFARDTNTTGMMSEPARDALQRLLVIPEVSGFIRRASVQIPLLDVTTWWEAPFLPGYTQQPGIAACPRISCGSGLPIIWKSTSAHWNAGSMAIPWEKDCGLTGERRSRCLPAAAWRRTRLRGLPAG